MLCTIRCDASQSVRNTEVMMKATRSDILNALGLEVRRSPIEYIVPAAGILGAGILLGVGVGLLLAPKPGRTLRSDIGGRISSGREMLREKTQGLREKVRGRDELGGAGATPGQGPGYFQS